jgi:hypothetical protein
MNQTLQCPPPTTPRRQRQEERGIKRHREIIIINLIPENYHRHHPLIKDYKRKQQADRWERENTPSHEGISPRGSVVV